MLAIYENISFSQVQLVLSNLLRFLFLLHLRLSLVNFGGRKKRRKYANVYTIWELNWNIILYQITHGESVYMYSYIHIL